jgi:hypothetical protein
MPTEIDQVIGECKSILAQCQISALQAASAAAAIGTAGLAPLESPNFTGIPTAPTPPDGDTSDRVSTTAFIGNKLGQPNGVATLDSGGIVPLAQLPFAGLTFKGTWNANTNTPHLTSGSGTGGDFYIVSVAGTTTLDGISSWSVGDQALFSGSTWSRIPYTAPPLSNVPLSSLEGIDPHTVVANSMSGSASPQAISIATLMGMLTVAQVGGSGLCPGLSGGTATFLRGDGAFAVIPLPDLAAYATLASPAFTGTATVATQARNVNSTAIASTAYVIAQLAQSTEASQIKVNGTASAGTSTYGSKIDHIHPTDTSRLAAANGVGRDLALDGTCTVPTQSPGDSSTRMASTAFVMTAVGTVGGGGGTTIPAGTAMLFAQAAAPTGWTKSTTHDNKALRVVSGTSGGGSGGSVGFSTVFGRTATDGHSLTVGELAAHTHTYTEPASPTPSMGGGGSNVVTTTSPGTASGSAGNGDAHTHPIDLRVTYVDLIICTKN